MFSAIACHFKINSIPEKSAPVSLEFFFLLWSAFKPVTDRILTVWSELDKFFPSLEVNLGYYIGLEVFYRKMSYWLH